MSISILLLLNLLSLTTAIFSCATPAQFDKTDPDLKTVLIAALHLQEPEQVFLHQLMFAFAKELDFGSFGEVRHFKYGEKEMVIKKIVPKGNDQIEQMQKEVELLKVMCDLISEVVYEKLEECKSKVIAGFKGCVEAERNLYIFQEKMDMELISEEALGIYHGLKGKKKAEVMVQITSKFEELHKKNIIHADIKPGNLMVKGKDLSDIRIIDLGLSNYKGKTSTGGTRFFISPEQQDDKVLGVEGDIYSLAMTFAMIEPSVGEVMGPKLAKECFDLSEPLSDSCNNNFRKGVIEIFQNMKDCEKLVEVMSIAIDRDPKNRFESMTDFGEAIQAAFEGRAIIKKARVEKENVVMEYLNWLIRFGEKQFNRIFASNTHSEGSEEIKNRILVEREYFGSKMII